MQFLKSEGNYNETVLEIPDKNIPATKAGVVNWYTSSSPAIVAFGNKRSYLNSEYIGFANLDIAPRVDFIRKIILLNNMLANNSPEYTNLQKGVELGLKENKIVFIYSQYPLPSLLAIKNIKQVYQNQAATIYRVDGN